MKTNLSEMIDVTAVASTPTNRPNQPRRRIVLLAAGLLLVLGGTARPVALGATDQNAAAVYDLSQLDQIPVPRYQARPAYPSALSKAGVTGEAMIGFIADHEGNVREAYTIKTTHPEFGAAAVEAVKKWKFRPGQKDGLPVNTRMQVPIVFNLAKGERSASTPASTDKVQPFSVTEDQDASPKAKAN